MLYIVITILFTAKEFITKDEFIDVLNKLRIISSSLISTFYKDIFSNCENDSLLIKTCITMAFYCSGIQYHKFTHVRIIIYQR